MSLNKHSLGRRLPMRPVDGVVAGAVRNHSPGWAASDQA